MSKIGFVGLGIMGALMNEAKGDLDHSAIVTFIEKMANLEVSSPAAASCPSS